ncbi:F-box protein At3g07870-like [Telopea speciosissima]|uniref:F-box protein At3g07870-like n=1 Tax=Telopea speciosissima TaxID=54955 RepID=UPI001CC82F6B|nr:F-box protein At3g07870-like [Telopea speciosissima]
MEAVEEKMMMGQVQDHDVHVRLFELEDILINVLSKLPVKMLLRFRCVCKRWRYLISDDPYLSQLHYSHQSKSKSEQSLLFHSLTVPDPTVWDPYLQSMDTKGNRISRFEFKFKQVIPTVLPTRFDMVCINDGNKAVHICNPATHEVLTLPEPLRKAFVSFGYVHSTYEYKVVRLVPPDYGIGRNRFRVDEATSFRTKCQVFTLGMKRKVSTTSSSSSSSSSWAWRDVMDSPYPVSYSSRPAFVNGAIHWLVNCGHMMDPNNTIIAFDVEREVFRLVPHPKGCPDPRSLKWGDLQLVELKGLLCLSCANHKLSKMDIWMFKDYHYESGNDRISGTWVKEYSIDLNVLPCSYRKKSIFDYYVPRDIVEDTKVLIETHMKGLGYYHLQNKSFEGLMHSSEMPFQQFSFYLESLRSPKQTISPSGKPSVQNSGKNMDNPSGVESQAAKRLKLEEDHLRSCFNVFHAKQNSNSPSIGSDKVTFNIC